MADSRPRCPSCGSEHVIPIAYGEPLPETFEAAKRGEVAIGGCLIWGDERDHKWQCKDCRHEFGRIEIGGDDG